VKQVNSRAPRGVEASKGSLGSATFKRELESNYEIDLQGSFKPSGTEYIKINLLVLAVSTYCGPMISRLQPKTTHTMFIHRCRGH